VALIVIPFALLRGGPATTSSASPTASQSADASASQTPAPAVTPRTTPPGTAAPIPSSAVGVSADIKTPSPRPNATETPAPEFGLWRLEGYVVDENGAPLEAACVVLGPNGCKPFSPKTDDRGYWFIDIGAGRTTFDFYFEIPGHQTVWWRVIPEGPTQFNVILPSG
jgi:hypothetical protein